MAFVHYQDQSFEVGSTESVLDCLIRNGVDLPYGCKQGVCHACKLKLVAGSVPARSQEPLRDTWRAQGYFLACRCRPAADLTVIREVQPFVSEAQVVSYDVVSYDKRARLRLATPFAYHAGQCVKLRSESGWSRNTPISSLPGDEFLEVLLDSPPPSALTVEGPFGDSFYVAEKQEDTLFLAGGGAGLAPLTAIARDARSQGHTGPIRMFGDATELEVFLASESSDLRACRAYLAGDPALVRPLRRLLFQAGMEMKDIHCNDSL